MTRRLEDVADLPVPPEPAGKRCVCGNREGRECGRVHCVQRKPETALPPGPAHMLPVTGRATRRRPGCD